MNFQTENKNNALNLNIWRIIRRVFTYIFQSYGKTSFHGGSGEKTEWNSTVAGRKVRFNIVDTSGGQNHSSF